MQTKKWDIYAHIFANIYAEHEMQTVTVNQSHFWANIYAQPTLHKYLGQATWILYDLVQEILG